MFFFIDNESGNPNHFKETFILSLFSNYIIHCTTEDIMEQKLIYIYIYMYLNIETICQH